MLLLPTIILFAVYLRSLGALIMTPNFLRDILHPSSIWLQQKYDPQWGLNLRPSGRESSAIAPRPGNYIKIARKHITSLSKNECAITNTK